MYGRPSNLLSRQWEQEQKYQQRVESNREQLSPLKKSNNLDARTYFCKWQYTQEERHVHAFIILERVRFSLDTTRLRL